MPLVINDQGLSKSRNARMKPAGAFAAGVPYGYVWRNGQPVLFQGESNLLPVENLAVTGGYPTDHSVQVTWTNPVPDQLLNTPNVTYVRIPQLSPETWSALPYPSTQWDHQALQPSTTYQVQVMLAREVYPLRRLSPVRWVNFTTPANTVAPLPTIPKPGDNTTTRVPMPPIGAGCSYEWTLWQAQPEIGWVSMQTGSSTTQPLNLDFPSLSPGMVYKVCYHELCFGVPGAEVCGLPWTEPTDWGAPCVPEDKGITVMKATGPVLIMAQTCAPDVRKLYPTNEPVTKGPLYGGLIDGPYGAGSYGVLTTATIRYDLIESAGTSLTLNNADQAWSLCRWVYLDTILPTGLGFCAVMGVDDRRFVGLERLGANTYAKAKVIDYSGVIHEITAGPPMPLDTWVLLTATYLPGGSFRLYMDATVQAIATAWT